MRIQIRPSFPYLGLVFPLVLSMTVYRVEFRAPAAGACPAPSCYEALVLDAAIGGPGR